MWGGIVEQGKRNIFAFIGVTIFTIIAIIITNFVAKYYCNNHLKEKNSNYIYAKGRVEKIYYDDTYIKDKGEEENHLR